MRNYPYKSRIGLSELQLRRRLQKQGWHVWRGGFLHAYSEMYPTVRKHYELLSNLLKEVKGEDVLDRVCYLSSVHHGMPDFICYHPTTGEMKFVECKLGHEQLSSRQVVTIQKLHDIGFVTEVHKLVEPCTKTRVANVNIALGKKEVLEKEMTIRSFRDCRRR